MGKILLVDDDKSIITILSHILTGAGHTVAIAFDGKTGLDSARQDKPDLIILDIMMPEIDGITVSGILFQDPVLRRTPVIILTAKGPAARKILDLVPNVRVYMDKPFDPPELLKNVQLLLASTPERTV